MSDVLYRLADGSPAVRPEPELEPTQEQLAHRYAGVLQYAHELLLARSDVTIGQAIQRAVEVSDLPPPPPEVERAMVTLLGKMFISHGGGFPTDVEA